MNDATSVPVVTTRRAAFTGNRPEFRRLLTRGALLELATVGFYRFWLATDMRRHLWSHSSIENDAPEYTGTAKELLIGFLFALAILAPIYLLYFLAGLEAERLQAFASFPLALFFYLFSQFAIYRARRYRLTRTVWRGVRFWMTGSGWSYAWRAGLWGFTIIFTLGLALPWARAALERYKMRHTSYGELQGRFEGTGGEFFKQGWWVWLLMWPSVFVVIPLPFLYGVFKAIEWRWWVSGLRLGDVRFKSDLDNSALFGLYWKVVGWGLLLLVGLSVWFMGVYGLVGWMVGGETTGRQYVAIVTQHPLFLVGSGLGYVIAALTLGVFLRIYLLRDVWQRVVESVTVHNLAVAENVAARGELVSALGEGFADNLDVFGF
jgi:uncharacterized membrane protein YjgN (DUF898 family)